MAEARRQGGFTLIEITLVVLIAGLLILAVLVARQILEEARFTKIVKGKEEAILAFNSYRQRYGYMPGDDPNAATRWSVGTPATVAGNGDGILTAAEAAQAIDHLRRGGFIDQNSIKDADPGPSTYLFVMDLPHCDHARFSTQTLDWTYGGTPTERVVFEVVGVPCEVAVRIEESEDDGHYNQGDVQETADPSAGGSSVNLFYSFLQ